MPKAKAANPARSEHHRWGLSLSYVLVATLFVVGGLCDIPRMWGISGWAVVNPSIMWLAFVAFVLLSLPPITQFITRHLSFPIARTSPTRAVAFGVAASVALATLFLVFRSHAYIYGDGLMVLDRSKESLMSGFPGDELFKPLTVIVYRLAAAFGNLCGLTPDATLAGLAALLGIGAFWGIVALVRLDSKSPEATMLAVLVIFASGSIVLYFGYLEHYALPVALLIWALYWGNRYIEGTASAWIPLLFALLAALAHALMLIFLIPLIALLVVSRNEQMQARAMKSITSPRHLRRGVFLLIVLSLTGSLVLSILSPDLPNVLAWPVSQRPYWFLATEHLLDFANVLLLASPVALALLFGLLATGRVTVELTPRVGVAILIAAASCLGVFWLDPKLGAARDWDLLTMCSVPLSYAIASSCLSMPLSTAMVKQAGFLSFGLAIFIYSPIVYEKTDASIAIEHLDKQLSTDIHYSARTKRGERCVSYGSILHDKYQRGDLARKYFERYQASNDIAPAAWYNLGGIYLETGNYDSAAYYSQKAYLSASDNDLYVAQLAEVYRLQGKDPLAISLLEELEPSKQVGVEAFRREGLSLASAGKLDWAVYNLRQAFRLDSTDCANSINLGLAYSQQGREDSAIAYLLRASERCPAEQLGAIYQSIVMPQIALDNVTAAAMYLGKYRETEPSAPDIASLESRIQQMSVSGHR